MIRVETRRIGTGPGIHWLGQAGFWIDTGAHRILIDPYLSDSLARKYAGQANDHRRMMPAPIAPEALPRPDVVLVTHAHTDHMDPETLGPLHCAFPISPSSCPPPGWTWRACGSGQGPGSSPSMPGSRWSRCRA